MRPYEEKRRHSGFTLIELMVVIAIVAILAGLLFSALVRANGKAQAIFCLNNLKQLQTAWFMYMSDQNDWLTPNISASAHNQSGSWVLGNAREDLTTSNVLAGAMFAYSKSADTYRCPADQSVVIGNKSLRRTRSFSLNAWLHSKINNGHGGWDWDFDTLVGERHRYSQILTLRPGPSGVFVFIDEHPQSIDDGLWAQWPADPKDALMSGGGFGADTSNCQTWAKLPADRHQQGANLSFADGHAVFHRWEAPKVFHDYNWPAEAGGDLHDLRYLQSVIPHLN
jgi:prepilin-type N-terminal cleavage/methylation domain-containing protein/prepilin-type processing-associated H-X9-DG protein